MSAQPVEDLPADEDAPGPRFAVSWQQDSHVITVDLDDLDDEEFEALPERARRWRAAQAHTAVEDIRWMADTGETIEGVAARLSSLRGCSVSIDSVARFLQRYGAHDVLRRLTRWGECPAPIHSKRWRNRASGTRMTEAALAASRGQWSQGPDDLPPLVTPGTTVIALVSPMRRVAHGQPVRGVKL